MSARRQARGDSQPLRRKMSRRHPATGDQAGRLMTSGNAAAARRTERPDGGARNPRGGSPLPSCGKDGQTSQDALSRLGSRGKLMTELDQVSTSRRALVLPWRIRVDVAAIGEALVQLGSDRTLRA